MKTNIFRFTVLISLVFVLPTAAFSHKAFEEVYYKGKTQNLSLSFKLELGYIGASELKISTVNPKRTSVFHQKPA